MLVCLYIIKILDGCAWRLSVAWQCACVQERQVNDRPVAPGRILSLPGMSSQCDVFYLDDMLGSAIGPTQWGVLQYAPICNM